MKTGYYLINTNGHGGIEKLKNVCAFFNEHTGEFYLCTATEPIKWWQISKKKSVEKLNDENPYKKIINLEEENMKLKTAIESYKEDIEICRAEYGYPG